MNIHVFFTLIFLVFSVSSFAQRSTESLNLNELNITQNKNKKNLYKIETVPLSKRNLDEVLSSIPGVEIQTGAGGEGTPLITRRGQRGQRLQLKLNGITLNQTSSRLEIWDVLPLELVESISVNQGIDFSTIPNSNKNKVVVGAGNFNEQRISGQISKNGLTIIGHQSKQEDNFSFQNPRNSSLYDSGAPTRLEMKNNQKEKSTFQLSYQSPHKNYSFTYLHAQKKQGVPGVLGRFFDQVNLKKNLDYATVQIDQRTDHFNFTIRPYFQKQLQVFNDPIGENNGIAYSQERKTQTYGSDIQISQTITSNFFIESKLNLFNEQYIDSNSDQRRQQLSLETTPKWFINQYFEFKTEFKHREIQGQKNWQEYAPKLIVEYNKFRIEGKYSYEKRAPTLDELYLKDGITIGNVNLKPENNRTQEISLSYQKDKQLQQITIFQQQIDNYIQYSMVGGYRYRPYNIGRVSNSGLELNSTFEIHPHYLVKTTATWQKLRDETKGENYHKLIEYSPQFLGQIWLETDYEKFNVGIGHQTSMGRMANRANTLGVPDKHVINSFFRWKINRDYKLIVGVDNILNRDNFDYWGFPLNSRKIWSTLEATF